MAKHESWNAQVMRKYKSSASPTTPKPKTSMWSDEGLSGAAARDAGPRSSGAAANKSCRNAPGREGRPTPGRGRDAPAGEKHNAVNLGQGFPDYPMPEFVKEAAIEAIRDDYNQYSRPAGHARLVQTLAARYTPRFGRDINPYTEIGVVGGATNAIFSALVRFPGR